MTDPAYVASTASGRALRTYHTDENCRLGPSEKRKREITVEQATRRDLELCSACAGTVKPSDDNDPRKYIRQLETHEP